ncbi:MAG: hypothetical protein PVI26_04225 [Chitinispirillia bacterium]|jgi:hypothetical protein
MNSEKIFKFLLKIVFLLCLAVSYIWAYVGPGTGLTAVGTALGLIVAVLLLLIGFVWFPLKKIFGKKKETEPDRVKDAE